MLQTDTLKIGFLTTLGVNVGDEFIREGIRAILDNLSINYHPYYINKCDPASLWEPKEDELDTVTDKYWQSHVFIQSGAPVYWHLLDGKSTSLNSEWHQWIWKERILNQQQHTHPLFINLGAGSCQPWGETGLPFLNDEDCVAFAKAAAMRSALTTVRDPIAANLLTDLQLQHHALPCPAFLAAARHQQIRKIDFPVIGINLMPLSSHYDLTGNFDPELWRNSCKTLISKLRLQGKLIFICHDEKERTFLNHFAENNERIFISQNWRDYFDIYSSCSIVVANRVHGAVCAAGFGVPAIIIGNDTRATIGDLIGIPRYHSIRIQPEEICQQVTQFILYRNKEQNRLLELRQKTLKKYQELLHPLLLRM